MEQRERHGARPSCVERQSRPAFEVADIFRAHGEAYRREHVLTPGQHAAMRAIEACRTATLGGHQATPRIEDSS